MSRSIFASEKQTRRPHEGGAAMVEAAIVLPLLMLIVFGIIEMGLLFRDYLTISNMTRSGVRVGTAASANPDADYRIVLAATSAGSALNLSDINYVVVFKAQNASGPITKPPAACLTSSQGGLCNRYTPSQFGLPMTSYGCASGCADSAYSPTTRYNSLAGDGPERIGVYVSMRHRWLTGLLFSNSKTITDSTIMRLEPSS